MDDLSQFGIQRGQQVEKRLNCALNAQASSPPHLVKVDGNRCLKMRWVVHHQSNADWMHFVGKRIVEVDCRVVAEKWMIVVEKASYDSRQDDSLEEQS